MPSDHFTTANQSFRQVMGNGMVYRVPRFQRDYSWTEREWDDLWLDMQDLFSPEGEKSHYMGFLVLQSTGSNRFQIIGGQQRLTTLSVFILAILNNLRKLAAQGIDAWGNEKRASQLRQSFIGYLNPVTLLPTSKLTLNRNNDAYFQHYIVPLQNLPKRNLKASEDRLRRAFEWFDSKIGTNYANQKDGSLLASLIDQLSDKLFFTVITVENELNAYKVFETLNSRGVRLSSTDLLKNHLFSIVDSDTNNPRELMHLEERWERLAGTLGDESFPEFLRTHWNSTREMVRTTELFKKFRQEIGDLKSVFALIRNLEEDAEVYKALSNPEDALWNPEQRQFIAELQLFGCRHLYPFFLSSFRTLNQKEFTALLRICSVLTFRNSVICRQPPNELEREFARIARRVTASRQGDLISILQELQRLYPDDHTFRTAFSEKRFRTTTSRNRKIIRYILFQIERKHSQNEYDSDSQTYDIEHILPENPEEHWPQFTDQDYESSVFRLGNLTILTSKENRQLANKSFSEKRMVYANSPFQITRKIAEENSHWDPARIAARQRWMATQAVSIWRVSQLS